MKGFRLKLRFGLGEESESIPVFHLGWFRQRTAPILHPVLDGFAFRRDVMQTTARPKRIPELPASGFDAPAMAPLIRPYL